MTIILTEKSVQKKPNGLMNITKWLVGGGEEVNYHEFKCL
jgi:hypothetical protein